MPYAGPTAEIAVIGGSGFYAFLADPHDERVSTPYGEVDLTTGEVEGRSVAFLPRHDAPAIVSRKVGAPQGRVLANGQSG